MKKSVLIELLKREGQSVDDWGNPINNVIKWEVFAEKISVKQSEFYQAASQGLKPSIVFEIYGEEFNEADAVYFEDTEYSIIRTYQKSFDKLELICERKVADGFSS